MSVVIKPARGTRTSFNALVSSNALIVGQMYVITDEAWIAVSITESTYTRINGEVPISSLVDGNSSGLVGRTSGAAPFGVIPLSTNPTQSTIPYRASGGRVKTSTPTENNDSTPKSYVDAANATKVTNGGGVSNIIRITQENYDNLPVKDPTTLYVIPQ